MLVIDSQVHIWENHRAGRPWPEPTTPRVDWPDGYSAESMLEEMDAVGVDRTVIVPPVWVGNSNETGLEAANTYPGRFAVMGRFDPTLPDVTRRLRTWLEQPHMLGIRMSLSRPPHSKLLDDDMLDEFWAACERFGIPVMIFAGRTIEKLRPVTLRYPGLNLVIDHMGCDLGAKGRDAFAKMDVVLELAKNSNVSLKLSMAPNLSRGPFPYTDINPFLRRMYDAVGPRRIMWGSDRTNLTNYTDCLRHVTDGLGFLSADDKIWILGKTAATVLNWKA
ncbi:putative TIM-barrel fold metal-dependent hydrolase [Paraburkholderia sp. BL27I4N3]|uniref:amidohydrolase family protein n=1 Tax=Paraburkholderia sp. BL27I4N3 TaxID=1938805 RepID=UPI000E3A423E|nr:amidohydrolase family protein [Paraburkholderia sp. BL27I4N3]REE07441.1 putative TIM-barrel fold metal-dependent hydrolase [Paraburkholderia sp. BL27I4N3]